jgi:cyclopropane fatty-acyl-phospholipid synthase-like methyltransferase
MLRRLETLDEKLHLMKLNLARHAGIRAGTGVLDVGCGEGTFAVCVAKLVGRSGKVTAVDISDQNLDRMNQNLDKFKVRKRVTFVKADAAELATFFARESFDMALSYRLIEELKQPEQLSRIVSSVAAVVRQGGMVVMLELSTETSSIAEENLIRLHRDIGNDYFPSPRRILRYFKAAGLKNVHVETVATNVSYSVEVFLESNISQDEVWPEFKERIMTELWPSIEQYGMRYPRINKFCGQKLKCSKSF